MPGVTVTKFFAPHNPKRPANFVVIKYFLLGLLISNSIESILIIPKILDVRDESKLLVKETEEINIKRDEVRELVAEKEKEFEAFEKEKERELKVLMAKERGRETKKSRNEEEEEEEEYDEEEEKTKKRKEEEESPEVIKRPQRIHTGTNPVAVFMLFYGATTLCLGIVAVFRESALLVACLIGVSGLGIVTILSSTFSLLMILSVIKDLVIAGLSYYYRMMIVMSDNPAAAAAPGMMMPGATADSGMVVDYSQPSAAGVYVDPTQVQFQQPTAGY